MPVAVVALFLAFVAADLIRRPTLRRLAVRNASRRKGEAVLVMVGSLLGTAIITASFIVGDTLGASIRDEARTGLGPIDVSARVRGLGEHDDVQRALAPPIPGTDGTLAAVVVPTSAVARGGGGEPRAEPVAGLLEVDFDAARRFGADPALTGFAGAGATPAPGTAVIGEDLARELAVGAGDRIEVFVYDHALPLRVRGVVPHRGVAGFSSAGNQAANVFVAPGTIRRLASGARPGRAALPDGYVFVSIDGGVFDTVAASPAVEQAVRDRVEKVGGVEVRALKADLVEAAEENGKSFTDLFFGIGMFSVIAGVLLLVNTFVMLADERKAELGMLRALGMKRNALARAFGIEGALYAVIACVAGAVVGIAVGRVIVEVADRLFNANDDEFRVSLQFTATTASVTQGLVTGLLISLLTVWGTSIRIGRLNVIRAIRDLSEPSNLGHSLRSLLLGAAGVVLGGLLTVSGVASDTWFGSLAGPAIAAFSAIPLTARFLPRRLAVTALCALALVWEIVVFLVLPDATRGADVPAFVVQGVLLVAAAVAIVAVNTDLYGHVTDRLSGSRRALAVRLGVAYPLARRFRTSMILGMYAIVVFTLTFLAVFTNLFAEQTPRFVNELRAGHDVLVDSTRGNPLTVATLEAQPDVAAATPLLRAFPDMRSDRHPEPMTWPITGIDERMLRYEPPTLASRDPRFPTDRAVWEAVLRDPTLAVVADFFLQDGGGPPESVVRAGETFTVINRGTSEPREFTVAAVAASDWLFNGAMVSDRAVRDHLGAAAVVSRHYVKVRDGADPDAVAATLTGRLLRNGTDAESFEAIVSRNLRQQEGFFVLMQGYLALGLLIGIAGLGVVMVRAVRERRRQIGMLRAMGFSSRVVRSAFLTEAAFVAVQGIVIGVGLALITSYQLLSQSDVFGDSHMDFSVPWAALGVLLVTTLAASLLATWPPAAQASRIRPAVALRIAE